jgi:hypothetical protein
MVHTISWRVASDAALDFWEQRLEGETDQVARDEDGLTFEDHEGLGHHLAVSTTEDAPLIADHPEVPAESALQGHVELGMTRAEAVRGNPSQVLVHLKRANPHAHEYTWEPALAPATITGDMPLGKDEAGEWDTAACMALNWFIIGALGGGKSNQESVMLASITGCPDALVWLIDRKGGKAARPWLGAIDWVATTVEEARLMLRTLLAEVRARALHGRRHRGSSPPYRRSSCSSTRCTTSSDMSGDKTPNLAAAIASECRSSAIRHHHNPVRRTARVGRH